MSTQSFETDRAVQQAPAREPEAAPIQMAAQHSEARRAHSAHIVQRLGGAVQRAGGDASEAVHRAAAHGIQGSGGSLPHMQAIQRAFGRHDVSGVQSHVGGKAAEASDAMGAQAYATGDAVAFKQAPDLHTAAHEAAHVVQQRGGVQLKGGVGQVGDRYEQHADAVADRVVQGKSAEGLLDQYAGGGGQGVQAKVVQRHPGDGEAQPSTLSQAVGFQTVFERDGSPSNHPVTSNLNAQFRALLQARFLRRDNRSARDHQGQINRICENLNRTINQMRDQVPDPLTWEVERATLAGSLSNIQTSARSARQGAYSAGVEQYFVRALRVTDQRLARLMSQNAETGAVRRLPGGSISFRVFLGSQLLPGSIVTYYGKITGTRAASGEGASGQGSVDVDENGNASPGVSATGSRPLPGNGRIEGNAQVSGDGPQTSVTASSGNTSSTVTASADGVSASQTRDLPHDWSHTIEANPDSIAFQASGPRGVSATLRTRLDRTTLSASAPEISAGDWSLQVTLEVDVTPLPDFLSHTATQNAMTQQMLRTYYLLVLGAAAAPVVGAVGYGAAVGAPAVVPVLLRAIPIAVRLAPAL